MQEIKQIKTNDENPVYRNLFEIAKDKLIGFSYAVWLIYEHKAWEPLGYDNFEQACIEILGISKSSASKYKTIAAGVLGVLTEKEKFRTTKLLDKIGETGQIEPFISDEMRKMGSFLSSIGKEKSYLLLACPGVDIQAVPNGGNPVYQDKGIIKELSLEAIKKAKNIKELIPRQVTTLQEVNQRPNPKTAVPTADSALRDYQSNCAQVLSLIGQLSSLMSRLQTTDEVLAKTTKEYNQIKASMRHLADYISKRENLVRGEDYSIPKEFIPASRLAPALDITPRHLNGTIRMFMKPDDVDIMPGAGGIQYFYNPEGLPEDFKTKWLASQSDVSDTQKTDAEVLTELGESWKAKEAMYRLNWIKKVSGLTVQQIKDITKEYRQLHDGSKVSYPSINRWQNAYKDSGILGLIPSHGHRAGETKVDKADLEIFRRAYANQNKMDSMDAWRLAFGHAASEKRVYKDDETGLFHAVDPTTGEDLGTFPTAATFLSQLQKQMGKAKIELARNGEYKSRQTGLVPHIERDFSNIKAGQIWVSDHRQTDVFSKAEPHALERACKDVLQDPDFDISRISNINDVVRELIAANYKGTSIVRLWLTAWIDQKTGRCLNAYLHVDAPNSDHVLQSFKWSVEEAGGLPEEIYIDNGKDYRVKDFAGNRTDYKRELDEHRVESLMSVLGIKPHFAIPRNARAKTIERYFKRFIGSFEKLFATYAGSYAKARPESTHSNIKKGSVVDAVDFHRWYQRMVVIINNTASGGKELLGRSPIELWNEEQPTLRGVTADALRLFTLRSLDTKVVRGNGYKDSKLNYWYSCDGLIRNVGEKVYGRRDPYIWWVAHFWHAETHEYLGQAQLVTRTDGMAQTKAQLNQLQDTLEAQRKQMKSLKADIRDIEHLNPEEALMYYESALEANGLKSTGTDGFTRATRISTMPKTAIERLSNTIKNGYNDPGDKDLSGILPPTETDDGDTIYALQSDRPD